jgi:hypothetical protein
VGVFGGRWSTLAGLRTCPRSGPQVPASARQRSLAEPCGPDLR